MFPKSKDEPAFGNEQVISVLVARDVHRDLVAPVFRVRLRRYEVLIAPVPEAAVNVDRDFEPREGNINRAPTVCGQGAMSDAVPPTTPVEPLRMSNSGLVSLDRMACMLRRLVAEQAHEREFDFIGSPEGWLRLGSTLPNSRRRRSVRGCPNVHKVD